MKSFLLTLVQFNTWSCEKVLDSFKTCPETPELGVMLLGHILQNNLYVFDLIEERDGEHWYGRPDFTLEECIESVPKIDKLYKTLILSKTDEELAREVSYVDPRGNTIVRRIDDLIFHTFDHCTYHRGQIATIVRQSGGEPAKTWFNRWANETDRGTRS